MRLTSQLEKFEGRATGSVEWFVAGTLAICMGAALIQVAARYLPFLPISIAWPDELARGTMAWMTFVGAAIVARDRGHMALELPESFVPAPLRPIRMVFIDLVMIAGLLVVIRGGLAIAISDFPVRLTTMPLSAAIMSSAVLVGSALQLLWVLTWLVKDIRSLMSR